MRIGIDFDNTIAGYDEAFLVAAKARDLVDDGFVGGKSTLRDAVRGLEDGEHKWQALQGRVYGAHMEDATMMPDLAEFLSLCSKEALDVYIVSHKTEFGHFDPDKINLREAALEWMKTQGFFDPNKFDISPSHIFFESTRAEKLARIGELDLDVFIDDLPEVLSDPDFPKDPQRVLYDPAGSNDDVPYDRVSSWKDITQGVFHGPA